MKIGERKYAFIAGCVLIVAGLLAENFHLQESKTVMFIGAVAMIMGLFG